MNLQPSRKMLYNLNLNLDHTDMFHSRFRKRICIWRRVHNSPIYHINMFQKTHLILPKDFFVSNYVSPFLVLKHNKHIQWNAQQPWPQIATTRRKLQTCFSSPIVQCSSQSGELLGGTPEVDDGQICKMDMWQMPKLKLEKQHMAQL